MSYLSVSVAERSLNKLLLSFFTRGLGFVSSSYLTCSSSWVLEILVSMSN